MMNSLSKDDLLVMREWLSGLMKQVDVKITFQKKDGSIREMICTLKDIPEYERKTERTRAENEDVMAVFDKSISEWRSFRLDSVKEIAFTLGDEK